MGVRVAEADPLPELPEDGAEGGAVWTNQVANGLAVLVLLGRWWLLQPAGDMRMPACKVGGEIC